MNIQVSQHAGFCYGVKRAMDIIGKLDFSTGSPVYSYGPVIHNGPAIERLRSKGVTPIEDLSTLKPGETLITRTHGVVRGLSSQLAARGIKIVDTTCPYVQTAQNRARYLYEEGYDVYIFGNPEHPEVKSIISYTEGKAEIIRDIQSTLPETAEKCGLLSQTTNNREEFSTVCKRLSKRTKEMRVFNTICDSTFQRQDDAVRIASSVDFMIIVGGKNSANTTRLFQLTSKIVPSVHIESSEELRVDELRKYDTIGITAGASTPDFSIGEVIDILKTV